jgi:pimeloyl-ACP methyl ester carboxylesterase
MKNSEADGCPASLTLHYADINPVKLHYASCGVGPLIVFLHGFPEFWYAWRNQLTFFQDNFHAVAPDLRGFNRSSRPTDINAYALNVLCEDIKGLVARLGHASCILVGHDLGGVVAWSVAAAHPGLVEKLVVINAPHPALFCRELLNNEAQRKASAYIRFLSLPTAAKMLAGENFARLFDLFSMGRRHWLTSEDRAAYVTAWLQPGALDASLNHYRASSMQPPRRDDERQRLMRKAQAAERMNVSVPTLVIWGEADAFLLPSLLDGLETYAKEISVIRVPGGSHWIVHEYPGLINEVVSNWVNGVPAEAISRRMPGLP